MWIDYTKVIDEYKDIVKGSFHTGSIVIIDHSIDLIVQHIDEKVQTCNRHTN